MSRYLPAVATFLVGVLVTIGFVSGVEHLAGERPNADACMAQAVRVYPSLAGAELKLADLDSCHGLNSDELATVRTQLQDFGVQAAENIAAQQ